MAEYDDHWPVRFPDLFTDEYVDYADCRVRFTTAPVPVAWCRGFTSSRSRPERRSSSAGPSRAGGPQYFAAHIADSARQEPYRPHLPHPRAYWAYAVAEAHVIGAPANPPDGDAPFAAAGSLR